MNALVPINQSIPTFTGNPYLDQLHAAHKARELIRRERAKGVHQEPEFERVVKRSVDNVCILPLHMDPSRGILRREFIKRARAANASDEVDEKLVEINTVIYALNHENSEDDQPAPLTMKRIAYEVCQKYYSFAEMTFEDISEKRKHNEFTLVRHEIYWRCREELGYGYPTIGRYFGRDHSTVLHGHRTYQTYQQAKSGNLKLPKTKQWVPLGLIIPLEQPV